MDKRVKAFLKLSFLLCVLFKPVWAAESNHARFQALIKEVRCVVCQNQSIADSNAPLAQDLRKKIATLIDEQRSNEEIKDYLAKRYGEFILLNPRFNKLTSLLWLFPVLCLAFVLSFFVYFFKYKSR
jgi:cytochrome c-type biogenesis protein CcmH